MDVGARRNRMLKLGELRQAENRFLGACGFVPETMPSGIARAEMEST